MGISDDTSGVDRLIVLEAKGRGSMLLRRFVIGRSSAAIFLTLLLPVCSWARGARGRITGVVKDATGAVVPNVAVTVTPTATGVIFIVESQANGAYLVPNLPPGTYSVSAGTTGFKRTTIEDLKVDAAGTLTQDVTLQVGHVTETVEVSGQTNLVETTSGSVGTTVDVTQVLQLAMAERNTFALVNLSPASWLQGQERGTQVSLGGGRSQSQRATIDGIDNTRGGVGVQNVEMNMPVDAVQEFRVQTNNMSAEYGLATGGVLNVVTKSGTNSFHGSLYEFIRNDKFDANGWRNSSKQKLRRNNYGLMVGGPIIRNRTFFFVNWDKLKNVTANQATADVGLLEWRTGNFSRPCATRADAPSFSPSTDDRFSNFDPYQVSPLAGTGDIPPVPWVR